ncbi:ABC transporter, permease protein [Olavius algarvensis spirochete endosymbiont]|uniref:ABC transporter permease n=1 Tax=Olavius algarvensis spirochete endosymbiont TaxID=260710 RepID=UPI000F11B545|nr:ABC transporter permease [Olavius algarvensis spirochete endosymbiont]VDA99696.1 ABC transporter, permease protein [Olavius algarvensis spirochete endosymbiont]
MQRFLALVHARNMEFVRDRGNLLWNLLFPIFLVFGFSFAFSGGENELFRVGIYGDQGSRLSFLEEPYVKTVNYEKLSLALNKVSHHQIDMVINFETNEYFINESSTNGSVAERIFLASEESTDFEHRFLSGKPIRYVDWFVPGAIGANMMFSCIFGAGWIIVRYRRNGVLKRLKATPVHAFEFVAAQLASRLSLVLFVSAIVYAGTNLFLKFVMEGSYLNLLLITILAIVCMISLGLVFASRIKSEELAGGLMNIVIWPMMAFSGVFFSLEGAPVALQKASRIFPLTHYIEAGRAIMLDGARLADISTNLIALVGMSALFLLMSSLFFRWE